MEYGKPEFEFDIKWFVNKTELFPRSNDILLIGQNHIKLFMVDFTSGITNCTMLMLNKQILTPVD